MIKLSKMTDYAVVVLSHMARGRGVLLSAGNLAEKTSLPEPTVAKILKLLAKRELIESVRGVSGGYRLERGAQDIPVTAIIAAMEGPIALTSCVDDSHDSCALQGVCAMNGRWNPVNRALRSALDKVTLADMTEVSGSPLAGLPGETLTANNEQRKTKWA